MCFGGNSMFPDGDFTFALYFKKLFTKFTNFKKMYILGNNGRSTGSSRLRWAQLGVRQLLYHTLFKSFKQPL